MVFPANAENLQLKLMKFIAEAKLIQHTDM